MRYLAVGCAAAILGLTGLVFAADPNKEQALEDKQFVMGAADAGMLEVQLGQYVAQNAISSDVKTFAQQMVDDHTKANDDLRKAASQAGIDVPTALSDDSQKTLNRIEGLKVDQLDKEYVAQMVTDHQNVVTAFEKESKDGMAGPIKTFAVQTLPTLRHHLEMAQDLNKKIQ